MRLPSFSVARSAILALSGAGPAVAAGSELASIVIDLFDDEPKQQEELKAALAEARSKTDAALDRLDEAIADREKGG